MAHDYANVDLKIVWTVATMHLSEVRCVLEHHFAGLEEPPDAQGHSGGLEV